MEDWAILSQGAEGAGVSRCPAGHIHVERGPLSLRFDEGEFLAFVRMLAAAARAIRGTKGLADANFRPDRFGWRFSQN